MLALTMWEWQQSIIHHHSLGYMVMTMIAAIHFFLNSPINPRNAYNKLQVTFPPGPIRVGPERVYRHQP